jgi:hypothetical protein
MENQVSALLQFISKRFPNTHFEVIHNSLSPTLKHFVIKDQNGEKGFGTDHNYYLAIEKAYSEFVERKTFQELHRMFGQFKTSNGFAAHIDSKRAKQSSINELIERDAFLLTWHTAIAPYWLSESESKSLMLPENIEINSKHAKLGLKLSLGIVAKHKNVLTCIAKVKGKFKGKDFFYIDTKTGTDLITVLNALIESITFYSHFISLGHMGKNINRSLKPNQPIDHFYYYLNHSISLGWFHKGSPEVMEIPVSKINTYILKPEEFLGGECLNRVVSFSESELMQPYYCGNFNLKNINLTRFQQFFDTKVKFNIQLHPLS